MGTGGCVVLIWQAHFLLRLPAISAGCIHPRPSHPFPTYHLALPTLFTFSTLLPQASKLDYVIEPTMDEGLALTLAASQAGQVAAKDTRFAKKMREVQRKQKTSTARAAKPSVEGRTITLLNN